MPSPRKRIGFLPRSEVQYIIDKICENNKLSQSKVTGILVEEALISRGVLDSSNFNKSLYLGENANKSLLITNDKFNSNIDKNFNAIHVSKSSINEEEEMIIDYIEYKLFKKLMRKNKIN